MNNYLLFRKLHRLLVLVMIGSALLMSLTGLFLKYPQITGIVPLDLSLVRTIHNTASPFFSVVLILMAISGSVMYFYPIIARKNRD